LKTRKVLWSHPLGTSRNSGPLGMQLPVSLPMGSPNIGGSLVTGTGVAFIAATLDQYFRAVDVRTGAELWKTLLPSAAFANPMTYASAKSGRQFVVIAVGGNSLMARPHGLFITAFALPGAGVPALMGRAASASPAVSAAPPKPSSRGDGPAPAARPFSLTRADPAFDAIIAPDARPELLGDHFGITEGPVWVPDGHDGFLLVSDLTANVIYKIAPNKTVSVFVDKAGYSGTDVDNAGTQSRSGRMHVLMIGPSCTALDGQGRLLWCADNDGAIMRLEPDGQRTVLAGSFEGKRFNGPNDLVLTHDGAIFFTDPDFGLRDGARSPLKQLDSAGVWFVRAGKPLKVLDARELGGPPDGIAISPDEQFLYLTAGFGHIKRYRIGANGTLTEGMMFAEGDGIGDGLKVDRQGNVYSVSGGGPGVVRVTAPDGKRLGSINLAVSDEEPKRQICASNLAFGGRDGKTLFIAACQAVFRIQLRAAGPVAVTGPTATALSHPRPSPTP
jgi:gluconolactonase